MILKVVLLVLAILAFIIFCNEYLTIQKLKAVASGVVSESKAFSRIMESPEKRVLIVGDSLGYGVGTTDPTKSIAGRLGQEYRAAEIKNIAVSGFKIDDALASVQYLPASETFDLVLIQIGGNDVIKVTSKSRITAGIDALLIEAKNHSPHVIVMMSGDVGLSPGFPPFLRMVYHFKTPEVRQALIDASQRHGATFVDFYEGPGVDTFGSDVQKYYSADKLHPSAEGYAVWYEKVSAALKTMNW